MQYDAAACKVEAKQLPDVKTGPPRSSNQISYIKSHFCFSTNGCNNFYGEGNLLTVTYNGEVWCEFKVSDVLL